MRKEFRLIDDLGSLWPEVFSYFESCLSDKDYVEDTYPDRKWTIQFRDVSDWSNYIE